MMGTQSLVIGEVGRVMVVTEEMGVVEVTEGMAEVMETMAVTEGMGVRLPQDCSDFCNQLR